MSVDADFKSFKLVVFSSTQQFLVFLANYSLLQPTHQDLTEHPFNSLPSLLYITGSTERL